MSIDEQEKTGSIRVINEEYERVLSNPDNMIMSEELQELMDLPIAPTLDEEPQLSVDTMAITIIDGDGLGVSVRGSFISIGCTNTGTYELEIESENIRPEFVSALERYKRLSPSEITPVVLGGMYDSEIEDVLVSEWSVERSNPHTLKLKLAFRSENVIL